MFLIFNYKKLTRDFIFELIKGIKRKEIDIALASQWFAFFSGIEYILFTIEFAGNIGDLSLYSIFTITESKKVGAKTHATIAVKRSELIKWYRNDNFSN